MKSEYVIEAAALGLFMVSAAAIATGVEHPSSPLRQAIGEPVTRRALVGIGMGLTAIALIYSPMGRRSGAHMNPAFTLAYWHLGRIGTRDAIAYAAAQFLGAVVGLALAALALGGWLADIAFISTRPGPAGTLAAFLAEAVISFGVMAVVLVATNTPRIARYTGLMVGCLIASYITFEEPLSGMSMNPARTLAPVLVGGVATPLWVYFLGPPLGMVTAGELYARLCGLDRISCAKLQHPASGPCIFGCGGRRLSETVRV